MGHQDVVLGIQFVEYPTKARKKRKEIQDASIKTNGNVSDNLAFLTKEGEKADLFQSQNDNFMHTIQKQALRWSPRKGFGQETYGAGAWRLR